MTIDYTASEARLSFYADTIGVEPPARMVCDAGCPAPELLIFCERYGASLDWIFLGDVRAMIRDSYKAARARRLGGGAV